MKPEVMTGSPAEGIVYGCCLSAAAWALIGSVILILCGSFH